MRKLEPYAVRLLSLSVRMRIANKLSLGEISDGINELATQAFGNHSVLRKAKKVEGEELFEDESSFTLKTFTDSGVAKKHD